MLPVDIIVEMGRLMPATQYFRLCVALRLTFCYRQCIPRVKEMSMDDASRRGVATLLEWWRNSGLELEYSECALDEASFFGHIVVLEWWKLSGLALQYSDSAMDCATRPDVLEWWRTSGLVLKYTDYSMDRASATGNFTVLDWWRNSGLHLRYSDNGIRWAGMRCSLFFLDWSSTTRLMHNDTRRLRDVRVPVLNWWSTVE